MIRSLPSCPLRIGVLYLLCFYQLTLYPDAPSFAPMGAQKSDKEFNHYGIKHYITSLSSAHQYTLLSPEKKVLGVPVRDELKLNIGSDADNCTYFVNAVSAQNKIPLPSTIISDFFLDKMGIIKRYGEQSLLDHLISHNPLMTTAGKLNLVTLLTSVTTDISLLKRRQQLISLFIHNPSLCNTIKTISQEIKKAEPEILNFFSPDRQTNIAHAMAHQASFENIKLFERLNKSAFALSAKNAGLEPLNFITFLFYIGIVSLTELYQKKSLPNPTAKTLIPTLVSALITTFFTKELQTKESYRYTVFLAQKFSHLITQFQYAYHLLTPFTHEIQDIVPLDSFKTFITHHTQSAELRRVTSLAQKNNITQGKTYYWFNQGGPLSFINNLLDTRSELAAVLWDFGTLEIYVTLADLYRQQHNNSNSYCFVEYSTTHRSTPLLIADNFWNPFLDSAIAVANSLQLGGATPAHIVVTGPNTGGKTTILKALAYNTLLAQTCGIAAAKRWLLTPFSKLLCHINVTDNLSEGISLFKAEIVHAKHINEELNQLLPDQFGFVIMDEAFRGTYAQEGEQISLEFLQALAHYYPNIVTITATHYLKLGLITDFGQWHVEVILHDNGKKYTRTFKLKPGSSTTTIARDILEEEKIFEHNKK